MPEIPFEVQYPTVSSFFEENGDFEEEWDMDALDAAVEAADTLSSTALAEAARNSVEDAPGMYDEPDYGLDFIEPGVPDYGMWDR